MKEKLDLITSKSRAKEKHNTGELISNFMNKINPNNLNRSQEFGDSLIENYRKHRFKNLCYEKSAACMNL